MVRNLYIFGSILFGIAAFFCLAASIMLGDESLLLVSIGLTAPAALLVPQIVLRRDISILEPTGMILLYTVIGTTMNAAFMAYASDSRHASLAGGESISYFSVGGLWVLAGLFAFSLTYALFHGRVPIERILPAERSRFPTGVMAVAMAVGFGLSAVGTIMFINSTGGFSLDALSQKRWVAIQGEGGDTIYGGGGYLRMLAGLSGPLAIFWLCHFLQNRQRSIAASGAVVILALSAMALPFFSSGRSGVIFVVFQLGAAYLCYRKIKPLHLAFLATVVLVIFGAMSGLRSTHGASNPLLAAASSGNGVSLVAVSHITQRVPERMEHKYGESYLRWIYSPIPRSVWPGKPELGLGREIKMKVTHGPEGLETGGRPPGFMGEGYINFGGIGLLMGAAFFGLIAKGAWNTFSPLLGRSAIATTAYMMLFLPISQYSNSGFSELMARSLVEIISMIAVIAPVFILYAYFYPSRRRPSAGLGRSIQAKAHSR
jgi:oligosaccharide repeat unit polymerase